MHTPEGRRPQAPFASPTLVLAQSGSDNGPKTYVLSKVRQIPHVDKPWTQGLEMSDDGQLVETSGNYPDGVGSYVRLVDPDSGVTSKRVTAGLAAPVFIEGISELNGRWFASTYMDHVVIEYDRDFKMVKQHPFPWQGWGLTRSPDGESFLATNSSEWLLHLDSENFQLLSAKAVTCRGKTVPGLNELEYVDDFLGQGPAVLGNVINTRVVLVIDPITARCTGIFHLNDLEPVLASEQVGHHVANGIAYNRTNGNFWFTGKNWDSMFEASIAEDTEGSQQQAVSMLDAHMSLLEHPAA